MFENISKSQKLKQVIRKVGKRTGWCIELKLSVKVVLDARMKNPFTNQIHVAYERRSGL